jgi:hypothetical protein
MHSVFFSVCIFYASSFKMFASMKALSLILGIVLSAFLASAQFNVNITMNQEQFLPGEAVPVYIHVTNHSGQTVHLGSDAAWLTFFIETDEGPVVIKKSDPPVIDPFDLGSSEVATKCVNLGPYFMLNHAGRYKVSATVHIKDWNTDVTSSPQSFDVIDGAQLWSQVFGVPNPKATNTPPVVRKYSLIEANYLQQQLRLYVEVDNQSDGSVVQVNAIGPMISFGQPEAQLDPGSDLHILYQNGASTFTYAVINPNGDIIQQNVYDYVNIRPRLRQDNDGNISVYGGVRRATTPTLQAPDQVVR